LLYFEPEVPPSGIEAVIWRAELEYFGLVPVEEQRYDEEVESQNKKRKNEIETSKPEDFGLAVLNILIPRMKDSHTYIELCRDRDATFQFRGAHTITVLFQGKEIKVHSGDWLMRNLGEAFGRRTEIGKLFSSLLGVRGWKITLKDQSRSNRKDRSVTLDGWPAAETKNGSDRTNYILSIDDEIWYDLRVTL
jgi:hypothetical protein